MKGPLVSIIVPIYNIEKYLSRCIDSIIEQTYKNLEICLVDDGSTDASGKICDIYRKKDNRIRVIHKENGGLSDARNVAIDIVKGEYIFFIDGDDYVSRDVISSLYKCIVDNKADIATTNYIEFFNDDKIDPVNSNKCKTLSRQDALESLMYQKDCKTSAWGKLYKACLFDSIRYPKGKICEDLPTTYLLFAKANRVCFSTSKLYFYFQRRDSIINSDFNTARMEALGFAEEETRFIRRNFKKIIRSAVCREFMEAIYILIKIYGQNKKYKDEYMLLKKSIVKNRFIVLFDKKAPFRCRAIAFLCCFSIRMTQVFLGKRYVRKQSLGRDQS